LVNWQLNIEMEGPEDLNTPPFEEELTKEIKED
jgi:hypothetical protein